MAEQVVRKSAIGKYIIAGILLVLLIVGGFYAKHKLFKKHLVVQVPQEQAASTTQFEIPFSVKSQDSGMAVIDLRSFKSDYRVPRRIDFTTIALPKKLGDAELTQATCGYIYDDALSFTFSNDIFAVGDEESTEQLITIQGLSGYERHQNGNLLKYVISSNIEAGKEYSGTIKYSGKTANFSFMKPLIVHGFYSVEKTGKPSFIVSVQSGESGKLSEETVKRLIETYCVIVAEYNGVKVSSAVEVSTIKYGRYVIRPKQAIPGAVKLTLLSEDTGPVRNSAQSSLEISNGNSDLPFQLEKILSDKRVRSAITFRFSKNVSRKEFLKNIRVEPEPQGWQSSSSKQAPSEDLEGEAGEYGEYEGGYDSYNETEISTEGFHSGVTYTITVLPTLEAGNKEPLNAEITCQLSLRPAAPYIEMAGGINVVETEYPYYSLKSRNVPGVRVSLNKLSESDMAKIIGGNLLNYNMDKMDSFGIPLKEILLNADTDNLIQYSKINLPGPGIYALTARPVSDDAKELNSPRSIVNVTNIGLIAKRSLSNMLIWTTDLKAGQPLGNVAIFVKNSSGKTIGSGKSNKEGIFQVNIPEKELLKPIIVLAHKGKDIAVVSAGSENGSFGANIEPWEFGIYDSYSISGFLRYHNRRSFLIMDSPIYRPGNKVNFKVVMREIGARGLNYIKNNKPITIEIVNPEWETLITKKVSVRGDSSIVDAFQLPPNSKSGWYQIRFDDGGVLGSFLVSDYRTPRSKFRVQINKAIYYPGETASFDLKSDYYFGMPIANAPIKLVYNYDDAYMHYDEKFSNYTFYEDQRFQHIEKNKDLKSGENGQHTYNQVLLNQTLKSPLRVNFEFTLQDPAGINEKMTKYAEAIIYPADFKIGVRQEGFGAKVGDKTLLKVIALGVKDKDKQARSLSYEVYRDQIYTIREKGAGNSFEYLNNITPVKAGSGSLITNIKDDVDLDVVMAQAGRYYLLVAGKDSRGHITTTKYYFYVTNGQYNWGRYNHDRIDLVMDKNTYALGDTIKVLIKSPYEKAKGLLTIENNAVRTYQTFEIDSQAPVLDIPVQKSFVPNVYCSVTLIQGRVDKPIKVHPSGLSQVDLGRPSFKMGYLKIPVPYQNYDVAAKISFDKKEYAPGDKVKVKVNFQGPEGNRGIRYTAVVVNNALFDLNSLPTNISSEMHPDIPLVICNATNYNRIVGRRLFGKKGAIAGGGGGIDVGKKLRKDFRDVIAFLPKEKASWLGHGSFSFILPDYSGEFKVLVFAEQSTDRFGYGEDILKSRQALLIENAMPNFLRSGDTVDSGVVVYNMTRETKKAELVLEAKLGEVLLKQLKEKFTINDKKQFAAQFKIPSFYLEPSRQLTLRAQAKTSDADDRVQYTVPVYRALYKKVIALNKIIVADKANPFSRDTQILLKGDKNLLPEYSSVKLTIDRRLDSLIKDPVDYLRFYPYECWEQKIGRLIGNALFAVDAKSSGSEKNKAKKNIELILADFPKYKSQQGLMSFWPESSEGSFYLTSYTLTVFNFLKDLGLSVDNKYLDQTRKSLTKLLKQKGEDTYGGPVQRHYILYELQRAGENVLKHIHPVYDINKADFEDVLYRYALLEKHKLYPDQQSQLKAKLKTYLVTNELAETYVRSAYDYWNLGSKVKESALAMGLLADSPEMEDYSLQLLKYLIAEKRHNNCWYTTHDNAVMLMQLAKVQKKYFADSPLNCNVAINGKQVYAATLGNVTAVKDLAVQDLSLDKKSVVTMKASTSGQRSVAFYNISAMQYFSGLDTSLQKSFAVNTEYLNLSRKPVTRFEKGKNYIVRMTAHVFDGHRFVVIDDQLPAALMPIDFNQKSAQGSLSELLKGPDRWPNFKDVRLDRVVYYYDNLPSGKYSWEYMTQAVAKGEFLDPGIKIEAMYDPEVQAIEKDRHFVCE